MVNHVIHNCRNKMLLRWNEVYFTAILLSRISQTHLARWSAYGSQSRPIHFRRNLRTALKWNRIHGARPEWHGVPRPHYTHRCGVISEVGACAHVCIILNSDTPYWNCRVSMARPAIYGARCQPSSRGWLVTGNRERVVMVGNGLATRCQSQVHTAHWLVQARPRHERYMNIN